MTSKQQANLVPWNKLPFAFFGKLESKSLEGELFISACLLFICFVFSSVLLITCNFLLQFLTVFNPVHVFFLYIFVHS